MARLPRVVLEGHPHHVTQRGVRSMDIFYSDEDREYYLSQLKEKCENEGVTEIKGRSIFCECRCGRDVPHHFASVPTSGLTLGGFRA